MPELQKECEILGGTILLCVQQADGERTVRGVHAGPDADERGRRRAAVDTALSELRGMAR